MKPFVLSAAATLAAVFVSAPATASEWGCEVLLCLSNPGSPTEFKECVPPIHKLYSELAKGHSFPTCTGVGFKASKPVYDPYECPAGYELINRPSLGSHERPSCKATEPKVLPMMACWKNGTGQGQIEMIAGKRTCVTYPSTAATLREKPRYVIIDIDDVGKKTVWF
ncbi:hypothetical protein LH464_22070 [Neorhizobium sp. T786]|uniref:hypothetical protein n=1 Tax=Pseudorhizobium xiangyangii TaxID=2883104 RepID=UPI001CFF9F43|nr:hypothetical protein [Neorhizobium xiangyangii]MCB5205158.1 hypothetical protein [Neorhizobium xiangyangii]